MSKYSFSTCQNCGGTISVHRKQRHQLFFLVHADPGVCDRYLRERAAKILEREQALANQGNWPEPPWEEGDASTSDSDDEG